MDIFVILSMVW